MLMTTIKHGEGHSGKLSSKTLMCETFGDRGKFITEPPVSSS